MEESKAVSTTKIAFKPEVLKIEKYLTEISIPQNFLALQLGENPLSVMEFPKGTQKFKYGTLSKTPFSKNVVGSFSRTTCELDIIQFLLPESIKGKQLIMKPFRVELLAKHKIVANFIKEFPAKEKDYYSDLKMYYFNYRTKLSLSSIWKDKIDLIRITWNIHLQESAAQFVADSNDNEEFKESDHFITMNKEMASFHISEELSDATIRCGTKVIPVHRLTLSLASPVFRNMFGTEMKEKKYGEVIIEDIDSKTVQLLIKWIYTGNVQVIKLQDQMDLFKAAHKYQIETLKNWCIFQIRKGISPNNALEMYVFGDSYEETKIMMKAFQIIKENTDKVFSEGNISEEFAMRYPKLMLDLAKR